MKCGNKSQGFTIVETLIFLAVSAALLVSALTLLSGSQNKTQFNEAMKEMQQLVISTSNNVANGYFPELGNQSCSAPDNVKLIFPDTFQAKGTNEQCSYLGRVLVFTDSSEQLTIQTVAGARLIHGTTREAKSMVDTIPTVVDDSDTIVKFKNGLTLEDITYVDGAGVTKHPGSIGFFANSGVITAPGKEESSALQSDFVPFDGVTLGATNDSKTYIEDAGPSPLTFRNNYAKLRNPAKGITLCFKSGTTNQIGKIVIGGNKRIATTNMTIESGTC